MRWRVPFGRAARALSDGGRLLAQDCTLRFGLVLSDADALARCQASAAGKGRTRISGAPNRSALMSSTAAMRSLPSPDRSASAAAWNSAIRPASRVSTGLPIRESFSNASKNDLNSPE